MRLLGGADGIVDAFQQESQADPGGEAECQGEARFRGTFGSEGAVGMRALSTLRILFDLRPAVTPASFNFSIRPSYSVR